MELFAIRCRFKETKDSVLVDGMAICKDPDTPITFIYPNGEPYLGSDIWNYSLLREWPWAKFES